MRAKGKVVVIDLGGYCCRVGFAGEDEPRATVESVMGIKKRESLMSDEILLYGNRVYTSCENSSIRNVFKNGFIETANDYDDLFSYLMTQELRVDCDRRPVVISEPVQNPTENRNQMAEILFEQLGVPSIYIGSAPSFALYTSSKTEGVVLDIGDSFSQVGSVFELTQIPQSLMRNDVGGRMITRLLQRYLKDVSYHFAGSNGFSLVQKVKETEGFVALNYEESLRQDTLPVSYQIAEDTRVSIGQERFKCPEVLFRPELENLDCFGAAQMIYESIMRCDTGLRERLWQNVVISGRTTFFTGFDDRLKAELAKLAPEAHINCYFAPNRDNAAWIGASIVGAMELFPQMVVTKQEFKESGASSIQRRFY